jgi:hypothetical protein
VVVKQFDAPDERVYQSPAVIYVIGVAFGKPLKEKSKLLIFEYGALDFFFDKLGFEVSFFLLPLLDLCRDDIRRLASFQGFDKIIGCFIVFTDEFLQTLEGIGIALFFTT